MITEIEDDVLLNLKLVYGSTKIDTPRKAKYYTKAKPIKSPSA